MPPKTNSGASKKTEMKKKEKIIEDKTFGLKNKKGAKNQKFIQQVQQQVKSGGTPVARKLEEQKRIDKELKEAEAKKQKEINELFRPVQKVEKGVDPKSILCAFFKTGNCGKGDKCKFSHDLEIERKAEKRSLYCDVRDDDNKEENSGDWDEAKLMEVVEKKHGEANKNMVTKTEIICKFFLTAVEKNKYGWFWECPNGGTCIYKHALPPGFVLKKDKKKDDKKDELSLEDLIERERAALGPKQTKVTLETFLAWKKRKLKERKDASRKESDRKKAEYKAGKSVGLSGREMFTFNPDLATNEGYEDGDEAFDTSNLPRENEEEDQMYRELDLDALECDEVKTDGITSHFQHLHSSHLNAVNKKILSGTLQGLSTNSFSNDFVHAKGMKNGDQTWGILPKTKKFSIISQQEP
nr:EOG090X0C5B [Lepidurus arcticus]